VPLPESNTPWPLPGTDEKILEEMREHAAWYAGDPKGLKDFYGGVRNGLSPSQQVRGRAAGHRGRWWWSRRGSDEASQSEKVQLHVPIAGDIATTSADLLFAEAPQIEIPEAHGDTGADEPAGGDNATNSAAKVAQGRLEEIIEEAGVHNTFLEMAEVAAGIGGAYLRPVWDVDIADHPLLTVVQADDATPEFRYGVLNAVTFHRILLRDGRRVLRHLERYEMGVIFHGLYEGTETSLGNVIPLTEHPETKGLAGVVAEGNAIQLDGFAGLFVRYIPNMLPNRKHRKAYQGRSDLQGIEGLMDALDETYSSWMRDIRVGQARVIVSQQYLTGPRKAGEGATFNVDKEIYTALDFDPTDKTPGITPIEFELRAEQHAATALNLLERAVSNAGYSAQSFGLKGDGSAVTATEIRARERKSFSTKAKKERYIKGPLAEILEIMLFIDKAVFGGKHEVLRPRVGISDSIAETQRELAESAQMLMSAQAASIKTRVQMVHPDWSDEEVNQEVELIKAEEAASVPSFNLPGEEG
jgi:hypothetical protein